MATERKKPRGNSKKKIQEPNMFEQTLNKEELKTIGEESIIELEQRDNVEANKMSNSENATEVEEARIKYAPKIQAFEWAKPCYIQLHRGNLYSIFSSALIVPAKYSKNRAFPDVQTVQENVLAISNGALAGLDSSQVLCEIVFTEQEKKNSVIEGTTCFLNIPIPISRVKKIYAADENVKRDIITTALTADGGIIPERLINKSFPKDIQEVEFSRNVNLTATNDYEQVIRKYDKILGAFAFIKNYSWLLVNRTNTLSVIPTHLFFMANAISEISEITKHKNEKATIFYRQLFGYQNEIEKPFLKWIFNRLNMERNFTDSDTKDFGSEFLSYQKDKEFSLMAKDFFNDLTDSLKRKKVIQEIWNNTEPDKFYLYLFAFLRSFGNSSTEDKSTSRRDIPEVVAPSIGEYIFACLGYFYGYKLLRNFEDDIKIDDQYIAEYIDTSRPLPLKFDLSTAFDYHIVEAVYQAAFYSNTRLKNVDFLDLEIKKEWIRKPSKLPSEYTFRQEEVLGKVSFGISRKSDDDLILEQLSAFPDLIPVVSELGVYCWRNNVVKSSINFLDLVASPDKWRFIVSFKREHLVDAIKSKKLNAKELIQRLEISKKHKEF